MKVRFKKLNENAVMPHKAHRTDAGFDLVATSRTIDENGCVSYGTGIAVEIPEGYVGLVFPRSSICKYDCSLSNAVGVIDSNYRGEISAKFRPALKISTTIYVSHEPRFYEVGERIAQLAIIPYPEVEFVESDELSDSERGTGGYGSTGK